MEEAFEARCMPPLVLQSLAEKLVDRVVRVHAQTTEQLAAAIVGRQHMGVEREGAEKIRLGKDFVESVMSVAECRVCPRVFGQRGP